MPSTSPGVTGRVPVISEPGPPAPPFAAPGPPFPPLAPRAQILRLVTTAGTVNRLKAAGPKVTVTGGAADAEALAVNGKTTTRSTTSVRRRPNLAVVLDASHLRLEPARP